jgi:CheY-like chemotaxis protein
MTGASEAKPRWLENVDLPAIVRESPERLRVFLADDDHDMRALVRQGLERDGHEVVETHDGLELLRSIRGALTFPLTLPDILLIDVMMPHHNGLSIVSALRQARWFMPVILMTALKRAEVIERSRALGVAAVFEKPLDLEDLRRTVLNASFVNVRMRSASLDHVQPEPGSEHSSARLL